MKEKKTLEQYKQQATEIHQSLYTYDNWTELGKYHDKIPITCKIHGDFLCSLANHLTRKSGCPTCRQQERRSGQYRRLTLQQWIDRGKLIHNDKYDYSEATIENSSTNKTTIICKLHGRFMQTWADHTAKKAGCPKCKNNRTKETNQQKYQVDHISQKHISDINWQLLNDQNWLYEQHHIKCRTLTDIADQLGVQDTTVGLRFKDFSIPIKRFPVSVGERQVAEFIQSLVECKTNVRDILPSQQELDIYIPSLNIAIEYCGLYWHSDKFKDPNYHYNKLIECNLVGIRLITIFSDEWSNQRQQVENKLKMVLNLCNQQRIYARQCEIGEVSHQAKQSFFNANHIQQDGPCSIQYGLYHNDLLVACVGLIAKSNDRFIINRYATSCHVIGGFSKLLHHIKKTLNWKIIETFADHRWSDGKLYQLTGFTNQYKLRPDYSWTNGTTRWHKFGFRRSLLLSKLDSFNCQLSEQENCKAAGLLRIFDCGKTKYTLRNINNESNQSTNG